jgi:two-component system cell cycle sensor histidine kinase/response regulator CckA
MRTPTSATPDADDALHTALGRLSVAVAAARTPRSCHGIALDALEAAAAEVAAAARALERRSQESEQSGRAAAGEATSRLAGGVAHLLNDLLTGVACDAELALSRLPPTDPIRKHVESVCRAAERGGILARDLLAVGREQILRPRVVRLNELLDLAPQLPAVEVDPGGMELQLLALVMRAREAMGGEGRLGIWTTVSAAAGRSRERQVLLAVTDHGEEIAAEDVALLCEAPRLAALGTGRGTLGLAAACSFVRQSGGTFEIHSRQGEGTVVRILLPAAAARPALASARPAVELGGTILLVEDDDNVRNPLAELLEDRGYLVLAAAAGGTATALAARHEGPIHLLVSDVMMPGMTGIELARALAPQRPEMRVLFTTGHPKAVAAAVAEAVATAGRAAAGSPAFVLTKPFTSQLLLRRINEVLRGAEPAAIRWGGQ